MAIGGLRDSEHVWLLSSQLGPVVPGHGDDDGHDDDDGHGDDDGRHDDGGFTWPHCPGRSTATPCRG